MGSLNTLRAVLVAGAVLAALLLALDGQWIPFVVLAVGIAAHGALWLHLWHQRAGQPPEPTAGPGEPGVGP